MSSICIQYQSKYADHPNPERMMMADLHINYWKLPSKRGFERFLDFGLLIHDVSKDICAVSFYLPSSVSQDHVHDLGKTVANGSMMSHLFNGNYKVSNVIKSNSYYTAECNEKTKPSFLLYSFGKSYRVERMSVGSRIVIPLGDFPEETNLIKQKKEGTDKSVYGKLYIRFRIDNVKDNDFGHIEPISNDFLQSAFSKMEMLNIHINEFREIPVDDSEDLQKGWSYFSFDKIHFYFIGSSEDEKVTGHKSYKDSRLLDPQKWSGYLGNHNKKHKQCIAYHWKYVEDEKTGKMPSNFFIRTVYSSFQLLKVIKYCLLVILLGFLGSLFASLFYDSIKNKQNNSLRNIQVEVTRDSIENNIEQLLTE